MSLLVTELQHKLSLTAVLQVFAETAALDAGVTVSAHSSYMLHETVFGAGSRYVWQVGGWGPCSRSCGGGRRLKTLACRNIDTGRLVPRRHCSLVVKPPSKTEKCNVMRSVSYLQIQTVQTHKPKITGLNLHPEGVTCDRDIRDHKILQLDDLIQSQQ